MKRILTVFLKVVGLYVGIFLFVRWLVVPILVSYIAAPVDTNLEDYLDRIILISIVAFTLSAFACAAWEWAALSFKYTREELLSIKYQSWWWILFFLCCVASYACLVILRRPNEGEIYVTSFLFIITIVPYYVGTLLFTPSGAKYVPPFAKYFRRWK